MARGGARTGSGRKKGAATQRTREIADRAASEGVTPLEVMIQAMRSAYDAGELREAASIAEKAAPYMHPRLSSVSATTTIDGALSLTVVSEFGA